MPSIDVNGASLKGFNQLIKLHSWQERLKDFDYTVVIDAMH